MPADSTRLMPLYLVVALLAAIRGAGACTSFVVNCSDGAVAAARTLDFSSINLLEFGSVDFIPAPYNFTPIPVANDTNAEQWTFKHAFVATRGNFVPNSLPLICDGLNDAGLTLAMNWQNNVPMFARYNASGPATAMTVPDFLYYALGMFGTVEEVKNFLDNNQVQLTTNILNRPTSSALTFLFSFDELVPSPEPDGTLHLGIHLHFTDATGAGLLVEGKAGGGGYVLFDTQVVTNAPAFDLMLAWRDEYLQYNFSDVPGIKGRPTPPLKPAVIPANAATSNSSWGYFGSQSRYLRTWLQLQDCSQYPWPQDEWSPGAPNASVNPPPASFKALKRAENYLGSVTVPMSQLTGNPMYGSMATFLRDSTELVYYYTMPIFNTWRSVSIKEMAAKPGNAISYFTLDPPDITFAIPATEAPVSAPGPSPAGERR